MTTPTSTKPYMMRAMYEWCVDNGFTPHLMVVVDGNTQVPMMFVKDGEIVLNINYSATKDLLIGNEAVTFSARFNGVATDLYIPVEAVRAIFARENGQGMFFEVHESVDQNMSKGEENSAAASQDEQPDTEPPNAPTPINARGKRPNLKLVK